MWLLLLSWNEMFHLLRILTIITEVVTIQPVRCIRGNKLFFLQVIVGNAVAFRYYNYNVQRTKLWVVFSVLPSGYEINVRQFHRNTKKMSLAFLVHPLSIQSFILL